MSGCSRSSRRMSPPRIAEHLEVVGRLDGRRAPLVVEHRELAEDVAGAERGQRDLAPVRVLADRARVAGVHDVAGVRVVALAEYDLAAREAPRHRHVGDATQVVGARALRTPARGPAARPSPQRSRACADATRAAMRAGDPRARSGHVERSLAAPADHRAAPSQASSQTSASGQQHGGARAARPRRRPRARAARRRTRRPASRRRRRRRRPRRGTSATETLAKLASVVDALRSARRAAAISRETISSRARMLSVSLTVTAFASWTSRLLRSARASAAARARTRRCAVMSTRLARQLAHPAEPRQPLDRRVEPVAGDAQLERRRRCWLETVDDWTKPPRSAATSPARMAHAVDVARTRAAEPGRAPPRADRQRRARSRAAEHSATGARARNGVSTRARSCAPDPPAAVLSASSSVVPAAAAGRRPREPAAAIARSRERTAAASARHRRQHITHSTTSNAK